MNIIGFVSLRHFAFSLFLLRYILLFFFIQGPCSQLEGRRYGVWRAGGGLMVCRWYGVTLSRGTEEVQETYSRLKEKRKKKKEKIKKKKGWRWYSNGFTCV